MSVLWTSLVRRTSLVVSTGDIRESRDRARAQIKLLFCDFRSDGDSEEFAYYYDSRKKLMNVTNYTPRRRLEYYCIAIILYWIALYCYRCHYRCCLFVYKYINAVRTVNLQLRFISVDEFSQLSFFPSHLFEHASNIFELILHTHVPYGEQLYLILPVLYTDK
jgi:hypothetical protein